MSQRFFSKVRVFLLAVFLTGPQGLYSYFYDNNSDEPTVKALFIYNFTKHIEWPKGKINKQFVIGVIGNTPVYDKLKIVLKDRVIKDHPVEIRKISQTDDALECDLIFIANTESAKATDILSKSDLFGTLIVTEDKVLTLRSACINIIEKEQRIKFELNDDTLKKTGLKISNQLYELAIVVKK